MVAVVAGLALLWHLALPFLAKPGHLQVVSDPPGATVHIPGQPDTTTPAEYPRLRIGTYRVTVSAPG